jgi:hypothetical protein
MLAGEVDAGVRLLAGEQLGERQRERVDIAARALVAAPVGRRADHDVAARLPTSTGGGVIWRREV